MQEEKKKTVCNREKENAKTKRKFSYEINRREVK